MGEVIHFKMLKAADKARGKTLCWRGFHKWLVDKGKQFDVKQGAPGDGIPLKSLRGVKDQCAMRGLVGKTFVIYRICCRHQRILFIYLLT